ncbi:circularly permuted type 2 ATP-grasp protein [Geodermatophilus sp. SYSU D00815]
MSPLRGYAPPVGDEAVDPDGGLRPGYAPLGPVLDSLGTPGLNRLGAALAAERAARGVVVAGWADGRQTVRPVGCDPVPRLVDAASWARLAAGVEQRHRALEAFLADGYRAAGRRRGDPDRDPEVVRAGVLPAWAVAHSPGRDPAAVGLAWRGQPRATVAGTDVLRTEDGRWVVRADDLRVPTGLGYALAARDAVRAVAPGLLPAGVADPRDAVPLLRQALADAAPPACARTPRIAVLTVGETDPAWFEHRLLADALGVPLVRAADLWPRPDGGVEVSLDGDRRPVDVLYRRFDDAELPAHRTPGGAQLGALLAEGVRTGTLALANVPGNGLADHPATGAVVPRLIRFYLGEEPLLESVRTWVLADPAQWAEVRDRLQELVVTPVDLFGGGRPVVGPECSAAELAQLHAEVAAAPYRFLAAEHVEPSTVPTLADGVLVPRRVDLRVFSVAGRSGVRVLPAPLTRVAPSETSRVCDLAQGAGTKDTWLPR